MRVHSFLSAVVLTLGCLFSLSALDAPTRIVEDDSSLRLSLRATWFTEAPDRVLAMESFVHTLPGGGKIQVRAEPAKDEFMVVLARERNGAYPGWAQGSWILTRRSDNGNASRIRIFLRSDPYTYIQFRPIAADRCMMDVVLYDAYIIRSLPVPYSIDRLFVIPVEEALGSLGSNFPRAYFDPDPGMYRDLRSFMSLVRQRLPELSYQDDGAIDASGKYVFINTLAVQEEQPGLNCSGFAKWIVDGLLRPFTGERLDIFPLKQAFGKRGSSFTDMYESLRDPFFGLDWTRNLASTAKKRLMTSAFGDLAEIEVRKLPFSWMNQRTKEGTAIRSYPGFLFNAGFSFEGLQPLLYTLAIDEPGNIYLASVNNEIGVPRIRQHFHVAVLVPYFNEQGTFQVAVFESATETSFNTFKNRYPGHFVNLVRIAVDPLFDP
ncbi:MAG: hypothetical protein LBG90_05735 [Spirochaetaceae bacterium]|jgi:hypothetical protein|nr:hypothetical protein [Spirochaetaceae bacterium]